MNTKYWQLTLCTLKDKIFIKATSRNRYYDGDKAEELYNTIRNGDFLTVEKVKCRIIKEQPPLLYNLKELQNDALEKHHFSIEKSLSIIQRLYEMKAITCPMGSSRYLSTDVFQRMGTIFNLLKNHHRFREYVTGLKVHNRSCVNDEKVINHHAILISPIRSPILTPDERVIYDMIAGRILEAFSGVHIKKNVALTLRCNKILFKANCVEVRQKGWKVVFNHAEQQEENDKIPDVIDGEVLSIEGCGLVEYNTY